MALNHNGTQITCKVSAAPKVHILYWLQWLQDFCSPLQGAQHFYCSMATYEYHQHCSLPPSDKREICSAFICSGSVFHKHSTATVTPSLVLSSIILHLDNAIIWNHTTVCREDMRCKAETQMLESIFWVAFKRKARDLPLNSSCNNTSRQSTTAARNTLGLLVLEGEQLLHLSFMKP